MNIKKNSENDENVNLRFEAWIGFTVAIFSRFNFLSGTKKSCIMKGKIFFVKFR